MLIYFYNFLKSLTMKNKYVSFIILFTLLITINSNVLAYVPPSADDLFVSETKIQTGSTQLIINICNTYTTEIVLLQFNVIVKSNNYYKRLLFKNYHTAANKCSDMYLGEDSFALSPNVIYDVIVTVDPLNKIKEADETNNTFKETLTPGYGLTTLGAMYNDFSQKIVINIENNGNFDLAPETNGVTTYEITNTGGTTLQSGYYVWQDLPYFLFLKAGYNTFIEIDNTLPAGTYTVKTCVDTENDVKEIHEDDNCLIEQLSIPDYL